MAQYYYDKFTSIKNETYDYYESVAIPGTRIAISNVDVVQMLNPLIPDNLGAGTVINPTTAYNGISIDKTGKIGMEKPIVNRDLKETVFKTLYEFTTNYGSYGHRYCYMQFTGPGAGTYKVNMFADYEEQNPGHFYTVTIYKLTPVVIKTTYSKGALVQANIAAEDGTYPADGRHTDGYWYVKKGAVGPTPPGTVTPIITSLLRPTANAKFVYLDNGWLVAAPYIKDTNTALFVSKDNGVTWEQGYMLGIGGVKDTTICAVGNSVAWIVQKDAQLLYYLYNLETHTLTVTGAILATDAISQNGAGASMFYDKSTGILHLAFSVRTSIYPSNYNIRYMNCVAAQGNAWTNAKMLTNSTELNKDNYAPSIVAKGNKIWIAYSIVQGSVFSIGILYSTNNSATFNNAYPVSASVQLATAPKLIMDSNDRFHLIYLKTTTTNGVAQLTTLWSDSGTAWQEPTGNFLNDNKCTSATITYDKTNGNLWAMGFSPATSNVYAFMSKDRGLSWESSTLVNTDSQYPQLLHDPEFRLSFGRNTGSPPPYIHETSDKGVLLAGAIVKNNPPSIAVLSPSDNQTLYENDTFNISGDAYDADKDQSVTSYYQINSDSKKVLTTNISQTQIMLSKQLKFKAGKLYDGESAITGTLAEGVAHALKVWAEDSEKASSTIVERSFYVVPNRAPLLTIDEVIPSGTINTDKFKISGTASDQDANSSVKVAYRINAGNAVEIYNGTGGSWRFDVFLTQLLVGENTIVVEIVDNYGAKTSKTIKLRKTENNKPVLKSVARYKIEPPQGTAKGVLFWIQRDEKLTMNTEISMTEQSEPEEFVELTSINTVALKQGIVEDEFYYETGEAKENIILKIQMTRPDETVNNKIHLISGVID